MWVAGTQFLETSLQSLRVALAVASSKEPGAAVFNPGPPVWNVVLLTTGQSTAAPFNFLSVLATF